MILDIDIPFGQIHPDASTFKAQLQRIASLTTNTTKISAWPRTLRLITSHPDARAETANLRTAKVRRTNQTIIFEDNPGKTYPRQRIVPATDEPCKCNRWSRHPVDKEGRSLWVTAKTDAPDCSHFVAVSYCWPQPDETVPISSGSYNISSALGQKSNGAPDSVIARALAFANHEDLSAVWIDQECIDQQDADDQEAGIQSMHLVYESAQCSVGLLSIFVEEQDMLDLLVTENLQRYPFQERESFETIIRFLQIINTERWFTRAWCMQESWSAGQRMMLLIQHDQRLRKHSSLGDMNGEVLISFQHLSSILKFLVLVVKAHSASFPDIAPDRAWLEHFARKTAAAPVHVDEGKIPQVGSTTRFRCSAAQALHGLAPRNNSRIVDRIAILANLCDYQIRLDTRLLEDDGISFSTAASALAVLNGDLSLMDCQPGDCNASLEWLMRGMDISQDTTPGVTNPARSRLAFSWGPPIDGIIANPVWIPEGLHPRRLASCKLTQEGLETSGYVFGSDIILGVSSVRDEHQEEWNAVTTGTNLRDCPTAIDKTHIKIIWSLVRLLIRANFLPLAQVIWAHENDLCIVSDDTDDTVDVPMDLAQLIDPKTDVFIFGRPSISVARGNKEPEGTSIANSRSIPLTETSFLAALQPVTPRSPDIAYVNRTWLSRAVMATGKLHCARQLSTGPVLPAASFTSFGGRRSNSTSKDSEHHENDHNDHHDNPMNLQPGVVPRFLMPLTSPAPPANGPALPAPPPSPLQTPPRAVPRAAYTAVFEHAPADGPTPVFVPSIGASTDPVRSQQTWRPLFFVAQKLFKSLGHDGNVIEADEAWKIVGAGRMTRGYVMPAGIGSRCVLV